MSERINLGDATNDSLSEETSLAAQQSDELNYIRNSVKATVDAYDGTVTLYAVDEADPVLKAWEGVFPNLVKPNSDVSQSLREHFRYAHGQHLTLRANIEGEDLRRSYSICSAVGDEALRIAVKKSPAGVFSKWANETLKAGDVVDVTGVAEARDLVGQDDLHLSVPFRGPAQRDELE